MNVFNFNFILIHMKFLSLDLFGKYFINAILRKFDCYSSLEPRNVEIPSCILLIWFVCTIGQIMNPANRTNGSSVPKYTRTFLTRKRKIHIVGNSTFNPLVYLHAILSFLHIHTDTHRVIYSWWVCNPFWKTKIPSCSAPLKYPCSVVICFVFRRDRISWKE